MKSPTRIHLDFETYSEANLKNVGAHRYALDPSTEVLCLAYAFEDEDPKLWVPGDPMPKELFEAQQKAKTYAFNTGFEFAIWKYVCMKKMGWPEVPFHLWGDTQAMALMFAMPASLDFCGEVLGIEMAKDKRGQYLISKLSVPQKVTKKNPYRRFTPETHPVLFEEMYQYCLQDVRAEREIFHTLPWDLPYNEVQIFLNTLEKNDRGLPIDIELVKSVIEITDEYLEEVSTMVPLITAGKVDTINQTAAIREWCEEQGYELPDLTAETVQSSLSDPNIENFPLVKNLLEMRQLAGKSSIKKFHKINKAICPDNKIRDCLKYHKATTGREGGRLLQPQNLPRASVKNLDETISLFKARVLDDLMGVHDNVLYAASAMIRPSICAPDGYELLVADYSQIENRMLCWLADQEDTLQLIRQGMCVYTDMASTLYGIPYNEIAKDSRERRHGKLTILGGGYGMGHNKFREDCIIKQNFPITKEEAYHTIQTFRERYYKVKQLWYGLMDAAIEATINQGNITSYDRISFMHDRGHLFMILPNGKAICYPFAGVEPKETPWGEVRYGLFCYAEVKKNKWGKTHITPGRLTENASQGASREVLMEAILDAEKTGFETILTVHDEGVFLVKESEHIDLKVIEDIFCKRLDYWEGLPLDVESFRTKRYHK